MAHFVLTFRFPQLYPSGAGLAPMPRRCVGQLKLLNETKSNLTNFSGPLFPGHRRIHTV